ncbi:peptide/nickel transport system substrate-binding protein [Propionibacterium cyclohexanicum]|uniref:Peptide/nickel transport system substrate-binding protein n=1 Tax=Propionibacterium cyclohexanicum TaxID=64702 RepID=A0A1H9QYD9_9ACTN|nr:ABC transporter substrate-binding protein [Propionibacterium cyclohexanicum]SER65494.1 peptide/nickel transport system substrate-binding protein [Propionibacterium cyclohexanicum]
MDFRIGRRPLIGAALAGSLASLVGCSSKDGGSGSQAQVHDLVVGATAAPDALDPSTNTAAAISQALLYNVYETLLKVDGKGAYQPLLAKSWTESPDGLSYTFTLEPNARFASGAALDASAVKTSLDRIGQDPTTLATLKSQLAAIDRVETPDPGTLVLRLKHPDNFLLYFLAQTAGIVYEPSALSTLNQKPAGSGPFVFSAWSQGESLSLVRNASYWGTPTKFDKATFKYYADPNAENAALSSGDLDIISNVQAPQALGQFKDTSRFTILDGTTMSEVVMGFNHSRPVFGDIRVRRAINYAINRPELLQTVADGHGRLIGSMVPPTDPWYEDLSNTYSFDPDKARSLLAEAGHSSGLTLALRVPTLPYATAAATFVTSALKDVGITVTVDQLDFPARWIDEVMTKGNYDMTIIGHAEGRDIVKWADPQYYWHYDNPAFQKLIQQAQTGPADEVNGIMKKAAEMLATDAAADFLYLLANLVVIRADLSGVAENLTSDSFDLTTISSKDF